MFSLSLHSQIFFSFILFICWLLSYFCNSFVFFGKHSNSTLIERHPSLVRWHNYWKSESVIKLSPLLIVSWNQLHGSISTGLIPEQTRFHIGSFSCLHPCGFHLFSSPFIDFRYYSGLFYSLYFLLRGLLEGDVETPATHAHTHM